MTSKGTDDRKRLKSLDRKNKMVGAIQLFIRQYGRKVQKNMEPNDRRYDRKLEQHLRKLKPMDMDAILRDGEDENSD